MRRKFWQTEKFRALQKEWEARLKLSGFRDAEKNGRVYQNASNSYRTQIHSIIENKQRYFELLSQWFHQENFTDDVDRYVIERRCEGVPFKTIGMELKAMGKKNSDETIRLIIRRYEVKWGIRKKP